MPRPPAPCGTMSAYRRHKRKGEAVDHACHQAMLSESRARSGRAEDEAHSAPVVSLPGAYNPPAQNTNGDVDARAELLANMQLVKKAMEALVDADPLKIVTLSKRHSELVAELRSVTNGPAAPAAAPAEEADPFAGFLARTASGGAAAPPRK